jgi:tetratricopeptide (TPR) repeat protein
MLVANPSGQSPRDHSVEKNLAGELADNNLYGAAIDEYKTILDDPSLDNVTRANIHYLIGKAYFENLFDYEKAAAHFIRARSLNPQADFYNEAGKNLIISLEKMGRVLDAKRELDQTVNINDRPDKKPGDLMVAKVGERPIYLSEVDDEIQSMPPEYQKNFLGKAKKEMVLKKIAFELMYQDAVRNGMDKDPNIIIKRNDIEKQLVVEKYYTSKVLPQVNIDTADVRNYYLANKKTKYGDKSFDEARVQVLMDYQQEKSQRAFADYIAKLAAVEKVQVFDENIK